MPARPSVAPVIAAVLAASALVAGRGGSSSSGGGGERQEGKEGGAVTFLAAADVDYLDPGQTYDTFGYTVAYAVNRTLYGFKPGDAADPVPDLAAGPPEIATAQAVLGPQDA